MIRVLFDLRALPYRVSLSFLSPLFYSFWSPVLDEEDLLTQRSDIQFEKQIQQVRESFDCDYILQLVSLNLM